MTNRLTAALLVATLGAALGTGCHGREGAHYGLGYQVSSGAAYLPPTASRGTTGMISYHEQGGVVARTIVLLVAASGLKNPNGDYESHTTTTTEDDGVFTTTTTTTTTTFTPTTPEERARREQAISDFATNVAPGIMYGKFPVELDFGIASPDYGGDTSGTNFDMMFQAVTAPSAGLAIGFGLEHLTFHDRTIDDVVDDGMGHLVTMRRTGDLDYGFIGFPIRATAVVWPHVTANLQWDLNVESLTDDMPSPVHAGLSLSLPLLTLRGTVTTDRFDPGAMTFGAEAVVGN